MQVNKKNISETKVVLTISAAQAYLAPIKEQTLKQLAHNVKLQGFREGKAPLNLIEKNVDQQLLQTQFVENAMSQLYPEAAQAEKIKPIDRPQITLKKFVPFTELEFDAEVEVLGPVKLGDYKKIKKTLKIDKVTDKDVQTVIDNLKVRLAEKKEVKREAKDGDQVWIDFVGKNAKGDAIPGADGKDYPLLLGSNTFIPGFEENLVDLKAGDEKSFTLTFPKDYRAESLAGSKVTFATTVKKVEEVVPPKEDDAFAKKIGPFKNLADLKADIKQQLGVEKETEARTKLEGEIIEELVKKSSVSLPQSLIDEQAEKELQELKRSLVTRGVTYDEFLKSEGKTDEVYRKDVVLPRAEEKLKTSIVLAEVSEAEDLQIAAEELQTQLAILKQQYKDATMQTELDKPEVHRDIAARLLTEKTINKLVEYSTN